MAYVSKSCIFALALMAPGAVFAATADTSETVTVTGTRNPPDEWKADLDPTREYFGGLTGEAIARDIDPLDRYSAFREFALGLSGPLGDAYDWHGLRDDGYFRPTREYYEAGLLCRDFTEETAHHGVEAPRSNIDTRPSIVMGTACHEGDGWHFR